MLQEELERFRRGEPILSRRISVWARTWRWAKRNRTVAALLASIVATFAIAAIVSTSLWWQVVSAQRGRARDLGVRYLTAMPRNLSLLLREHARFGLSRTGSAAAVERRSHAVGRIVQSIGGPGTPGIDCLGTRCGGGARGRCREVIDQMFRTSPGNVEELIALCDGLGKSRQRRWGILSRATLATGRSVAASRHAKTAGVRDARGFGSRRGPLE